MPDAKSGTATVWFIFVNMREKADLKSPVKKFFLIGKALEVTGYEGDFIKVKDPETKDKGYVFKWLLIDNGETKLTVNTYNNVYKGKTEINTLEIKYNGSKNIIWSLDRRDVVQVTQGTEKNMLTVTGLDFGTATLTVRAGLSKAECKLYCGYEWKQDWTTKAKTATTIYKGPGSECGKKADLAKDEKFIVKGDDGGSAGWAYGYTTKNQKNYWGYVRVENISTKGTVSQYNSMGWTYPIKNTNFKNIFSVYGWRNGSRHLGFDINKGEYSTILGEKVVAPYDGKVVFVNKSYNYSTKKPDYGYCIIIATNTVDPISGNSLYVVYMHLNKAPTLGQGDEVDAGDTIGEIGTTGNSTGPHLHLEINNKGTNFAGSYNSDSFDKTINPIFFYLNSGLKDGTDSSFNEYWYNDDK